MKSLLLTTFPLEADVLDGIFQKLDQRSLKPILVKARVTQEEVLLFLSRSRELPGSVSTRPLSAITSTASSSLTSSDMREDPQRGAGFASGVPADGHYRQTGNRKKL